MPSPDFGGDEFGVILDCVQPEESSAAASALAQRIIASVGRPIRVGIRSWRSARVSASPSARPTELTPKHCSAPPTWRCIAPRKAGAAHIASSARPWRRPCGRALPWRRTFAARWSRMTFSALPASDAAHGKSAGRLRDSGAMAPSRSGRGPARDVHPDRRELGLIADLTYYLLRRACLDARDWPPTITIALNISPLHLADPLLPVKLLAVLSETDFPPTRLEIEVTSPHW